MTKQILKADDNSTAIQTGNSSNVSVTYNGIAPEQMSEIMQALAQQLPAFANIARQIVDDRIEHFEEKVINKFAQATPENTEAFKNPDFQYLLNKSQHAYARCGDENVGDLLADLILERSKCKDRNRMSLSLNEAVEKTAILTNEEFISLAVIFFFKSVKNTGVNNFSSFIDFHRPFIKKLAPLLPNHGSAIQYLISQGCITLTFGQSIGLYDAKFKETYSGIFSKGFTEDFLKSKIDEELYKNLEDNNLIIKCLNDSEKLQLNAQDEKTFLDRANKFSLETESKRIWQLFKQTLLNTEEFDKKIIAEIPEYEILNSLWRDTDLGAIHLTPVGIAIAHSYLSSHFENFKPDLNIWIK